MRTPAFSQTTAAASTPNRCNIKERRSCRKSFSCFEQTCQLYGWQGSRMARAATSNVVLAFDIETGGDGINFPDKWEHPVFQIGCIVGQVGCNQPSSHTVFTWKATAAIMGADCVVMEDEVAMLNSFSSFVIRTDPDVITGFNVCKFDLKYIIERMRKLRLNSALCIGRMGCSPIDFSHTPCWPGVKVTIPGRVVHDVLPWIKKIIIWLKQI
jgi:DNA polymerase elongation subunit (family B)